LGYHHDVNRCSIVEAGGMLRWFDVITVFLVGGFDFSAAVI
jgi:hypothetical protein